MDSFKLLLIEIDVATLKTNKSHSFLYQNPDFVKERSEAATVRTEKYVIANSACADNRL